MSKNKKNAFASLLRDNCRMYGVIFIIAGLIICFIAGILLGGVFEMQAKANRESYMTTGKKSESYGSYGFLMGLLCLMGGVGTFVLQVGIFLYATYLVIPTTDEEKNEWEIVELRKLEKEQKRVAEQQRQEEEQKRIAEQRRQEEQKYIDTAFREARSLFGEKKFEEAMNRCDAVLEKIPHAYTFLLRAMIWEKREKYKEMLEDCTCAIDLDSTLQQAYWVRATALKNLIETSTWNRHQRRDEAIADLSKLTPGDKYYAQAQNLIREMEAYF